MSSTMMQAVRSFLIRLGRSRGGNVAMVFALTLVPLIGVLGGAIDFGVAISNKSSLQDAADAAALAGAQAANTYISQNGTAAAQISQAIVLGNTTAQSIFNANLKTVGNEATSNLIFNTTVTSGSPTVVITANGLYTPYLLPILGIKTIPISVTSSSTMSPTNSYYQIIFLVDISGSMSIGGDQSTISAMLGEKAFNDSTNTACAFACHDTGNLESVQATSWCDTGPSDAFCKYGGGAYCPYGTGNCPMVQSTIWANKRKLAKLYGHSLKIDYVNSAIQSFMTQLSSYSTKYPNRYTVAIDTFGTNFIELQKPTTNMATATTAASAIDIEPITGPVQLTNWGYTYTTSGLTNALSHITNMGDGSSATKMKTYLIFLTDAVEDIPGYQIYGRGADLNYASQCTILKNAGISLFTIWTPYYNTGDIQYKILVEPLVPNMPSTMQNCATNSSQYFQANDGPGITAAVNSTFNTIIANSKLRITG